MKTYFRENIDNPKVLQQAVFVNISIYFGRRGRENIRQLKITEFAVTTDAAGDLYLYKESDERTKNHQEDGGKKEARMYQVKGEQMMEKIMSCPLRPLGNRWIVRTYGLYYTDCIPYISVFYIHLSKAYLTRFREISVSLRKVSKNAKFHSSITDLFFKNVCTDNGSGTYEVEERDFAVYNQMNRDEFPMDVTNGPGSCVWIHQGTNDHQKIISGQC